MVLADPEDQKSTKSLEQEQLRTLELIKEDEVQKTPAPKTGKTKLVYRNNEFKAVSKKFEGKGFAIPSLESNKLLEKNRIAIQVQEPSLASTQDSKPENSKTNAKRQK